MAQSRSALITPALVLVSVTLFLGAQVPNVFILASRYLGEEELSFTEIAFLLGYSNPSAFSVAYKRWTGRSPRTSRADKGRGFSAAT